MPPRKRKIKVVATSPEKPRFNFELIETVLSGQKDEKNHPNLIKKLKDLYQKMAHETFMRSFIQSLKAPMCLEEGNPYANNRLKLCATFIADPAYCEQEETHPLIMAIFDFLLSTISQNAIVRFRICQFVNMVLNAMGPEASLDDDICDRILKYHLERMRDVAPSVRVQAVLALQRLQNPEDPEDDVFRIYIFHMESDVSPIVRQAVITSLGRNYRTIPYILERLWDVDERVRRHTYIQMSSYPVKQYKVAQRLTFLEQGLNDHSEKVQRVVKNVLIPQWFESYQKNYVAFVKALKIDADEKEMERFGKTAKLALGEIFAKYGINDATTMLGLREEDKTIPLENLTIETAICWQALLEFLQHTESDELDAYMVDLSAFCNYIKMFADTPTLCNYIRQLADDPSMTTDKLQKMYFQSMVQVLLEIVASYDLGDEVGRENLKKVLAEMLACGDLGEGNVKTIMAIFERLVGDVEERFRFIVDLINGILEPSRADVSNSSRSLVDEYLEKNPDKNLQMKISSLRLTIMDLKEQEMENVNKKDYSGAQRVSEELAVANEEYAALLKPILMNISSASDGSSIVRDSMLKPKKITNATINKCLQILFYLVNSNSVKSLTPIVCELNKTFISRYVESTAIDTRDWALKCSIAFSMLYDGLSKDTFQLLYQQFFRNHCTRIWETSISGIFELLDRYGFEHFDVESKKDESRKNSRQLFNTRDYLDQDDDANSSNTGSGVDLMKMMTHFFETCEDSVICLAIVDGFCRMIVRGHYTSPDIMAKLLLKYFNPTTEPKMQQILSIFHETLIKKKRQEILQKALLTTLFTILEAPNENPLHEVKPDHVLRFVINSTKPVFCSPGLNPHNTIAMSFLEVMKDNLTYKDLLKLLSKELLTLEISDDQVLKNDLIAATDKVCEEPTLDPKITKNLSDFKQILQGTYREPLAFSSTKAPPLASEDQEADPQNSDGEEVPEVAEEEPSTTRESTVAPLINKSSLDKDNDPPPKSPAKTSTSAAAVAPVSPVTPTTFGSRNTSGMKSLRKSMQFAPPTEKSTPKEVFKVPDANATKKLRAQQQKKVAAEKTTTKPTPAPEPESTSEEITASESLLEVSSFAIPSTQDTSVANSSLDGDHSILHLEILETQRDPEEQQPDQEMASSPEVVKRTPTKRKPASKGTTSEDDVISASSDESPASSRKRLDGSLEEVGPSPNATISRFDRSVVRPLVKASAKSLVEASKRTPKTLPRTRGIARNETINSKIQTRKSLTEITSKKGASSRTSLTGIEPLTRSPTRKEPSPSRKKEVASKSAPKKAQEIAKPAQKKTSEPSKNKESEKPATVSTRSTRTSVEPPKSATTATERRKIYAATLKSKTDSKSKKSSEESTTKKKDETPPVQKRTALRRTLEKSPAVSSPSTRSSRATATNTAEKLSPPAKKPSPSGEAAAAAGGSGGVTVRKGVRSRTKTSSTTDSPAAKSSTSATSLSSSSSESMSRGNRTPSSRRSLRSSKGSAS